MVIYIYMRKVQRKTIGSKWLLSILCHCIISTGKAQNAAIDSIQQLLIQAIQPAQKIPLLHELATQFIYIKPDTTIALGKEALTLSLNAKDQKNACISLNTIGFGYWGKGNSTTAFDYYRQSLQIAERLKDEVLIACNYQNIGNIYNQSAYYSKAISILKTVLPIYEKRQVYDRLPFAVNSIAYAYLYTKQYDSATRYLDMALPLAKKHRPLLYPTVVFNRADIAFRQKKYAAAREYLLEAMQLATDINDKRMISRSNQLLAEINLLEGNIDSAFVQASKAVEVADAAGIKESAFPSYLTLSRVSEAKGNKDAAIQYLQTHMSLKDSVRGREVGSAISLYEYDQQQNKIEVLKVEKQQSRTLLYGTILAAFLLGSFLLYMIKMRRQTERTNKLLEQKNQEIALQAGKLKDLNEVKSKLFSIVAHDLRSPLASIVGILQLLEDDSIKPEDIAPHLPALSQNVGETITMLDNLLHWSRSQLQGVTVHPEIFNVNEVIRSKIKLYEQEAKRKGISFNTLLSHNETVYADKNMVAIVLQNLINNAVKFTGNGGTIKVNAQKSVGKNVLVSVSDTGMGIASENIGLLINGQGFTTKGTAQEKGIGLGFQICKEFVVMNKGKIDIESEENKGTTIKVMLPEAG